MQRTSRLLRIAVAVASPVLAGAISLFLFAILDPMGVLGSDYSIIVLIHVLNFSLGTISAAVTLLPMGRSCGERFALTVVVLGFTFPCYFTGFSVARTIGRIAGVGWG